MHIKIFLLHKILSSGNNGSIDISLHASKKHPFFLDQKCLQKYATDISI